MAAYFSPRANPLPKHSLLRVSPETEVNLLITTDVMSEGLNLQDCDVVVNYDLHWNPVRLIQRFGRIDRIGTENEVVWGFNFLPEKTLERHLGLQQVLQHRIKEIHETIGEDSAILDQDEQINEAAMFAVYEQKKTEITQEEEEEAEWLDLGEAEEMLRMLRTDEPEEFKRITALPDGIRSARSTLAGQGRYVLCRAGKFQQVYLLDPEGQIISRSC